MNKLSRTLNEMLPSWVNEWRDVLLPAMEVTLIAVGSWLLMRLVRRLTRQLTEVYALPVRLTSLFSRTAGVVIYGGALLWVLERLGVSGSVLWTAFTGFATVAAVAFFAAWSVLSNLFCAVLIYVTRAFRIGDVVELLEGGDKPGVKGQVIDINMVYTTLQESGEGGNGTTLQLPNSLFFQRTLRRWHGPAAADVVSQSAQVRGSMGSEELVAVPAAAAP